MKRFAILLLMALAIGLTGAVRDVRQPLKDIFHGHIDELKDLDAKLCAADEILQKASDNLSWTCGPVWQTWTPVFTGFSVDPPVQVARYTQTGKTVTARMRVADGTSNATTYTVTLPVAASSDEKQYFAVGPAFNNGTTTPTTPILLVTRTGSITADIFLDMASATWSASGGKHAQFTITYETN